MGIELKLTDNTGLYRNALLAQVQAALEAVGGQAETNAKNNLTAASKVDTDNLRGSITHEVRIAEDAVYIGTPVKYAKYIEYGTGIHGEKPTGSGEKSWWVYVPGGDGGGEPKGKRYTKQEAYIRVLYLRQKGIEAYMTQGQKPTHFLRNAIQEHKDEYKGIIEQHLRGG